MALVPMINPDRPTHWFQRVVRKKENATKRPDFRLLYDRLHYANRTDSALTEMTGNTSQPPPHDIIYSGCQ